MTVAQILTTTRFITNTNSVTFTDANAYRVISNRNTQLVIQLSKLKEDYLVERSTHSLVANQEEYLLPSDCIRLKRLEIQWTSGGTWYPVSFYDINESGRPQDSTTINNEHTTSLPFADVFDESLFLRPIPTENNTDGLKLWYVMRPADVTATTDTPDSPLAYHRLLCDLIALDVRQMKGEISPAQALQEEQLIWQMLKDQVSPRVTDQAMIMKPAYENYE